ncbi:MAG: YjbH domain-containing protein, partial [Melioribacteraceae bacterium]
MKVILKYFFVIVLFVSSFLYSQSMTGLSGLYSIPTAEINADKSVTVGTNYYPKQKLDFLGDNKGAQIYYLTLGYMPFFEFSVRLTRPFGEKGEGFAIGDRMFSARVKFINESDYIPSVAVGMHDFMAANGGEKAKRFNANYFTLTKNFAIGNVIDNIGITTGYGVKLRDADDFEF